MKNFTKTITNKTLFKPTRWLIMALMLLLGTSSAWGYCASAYIATWDGSSNKQVKLYDGCTLLTGISSSYSDGITYEVGSTFGIDFYVITDHSTDYSNGKVYYSINGGTTQSGQLNRNGDYSGKRRYSFYLDIAATDATKLDVWITVPNSDDNWKLDNDKQYTFNFTRQSSGEDCTTDDTKIRVEFKNPSGWTPYIWAWVEGGSNFTGGSWPGEEMNYDSETGYHYYVIDRGNTSTNQTVNVIFSNEGSNQKSTISGLKWSKVYKYDTDGKQEDEDCLTPSCVTINDLDISASKTSICDGESVTFTLNNKQSDVTYKIGSTTIFNSNDEKPTYNTGAITGVSSKSYKIDAEATDQCEAKTKTFTIEVNDLPGAPTNLGFATICKGETATLPEVTGSWYEDANTITPLASREVQPTETTSYFATSKSNNCESSSRTEYVVTVKSLASANNYELTKTTAVYTGTAVTLQTSDVNVKYNAGTVSTIYFKQNGNTVNPINVGEYDVYVTTVATDDICAGDIKIGTFIINKANQTTPTITANSTNICGKEATFAVSGGESTGNYSYTFDKNDANATREGTTLKATQSGSVTLKVKKLGDTNYNDSEEAVKEFNFTMPIENVTLSKVEDAKTTYCVGDRVEFKLNYNGPYPTDYAWSGSAMGSLEATGKTAKVLDNGASWYIDFAEAKTYTIVLSLTGCNDTQVSNELSFTVNALPGKPTFDEIPAQCDSYTLPTNDKGGLPIKWYETMESVTPLSDNTTVTASGTYYAEGVNGNCVSEDRAQYTVTVNPTPTITGKSVTQPNTEITLTSIQGVTWSVSPTENVTLTDNGDGTATFSASVIGEFVVSAEKEKCSTEYPITVTDKGNIIYVRRPKSEDGNNYTYWYNSAFMGEEYYGTQNYIKNGDDFSTASENNKNGTAPTVPAAFTDCDGYVWDKFEVLGYESFFVHAPVQTGFGGYSTFTQTIDVALEQPEMYVTIGTWVSGLGAPITKVEAPSLVKVYASGETTLGANKFAALYVTDCSGREIDTYQWEYRSTEDETYTNYIASVSNSGTLYSGDAGTTNNIRPSVAGFYRCTVTYIGGGTATSAAKEVTGTYSYLESNIPVIVVNTNGVGFPDCPSTGGTASLNADVLKEKRSVDVKIYNGTTLVYDRKARMNYRGSSSLNFQKKSYAFCPGKDNCVEDKGRQDYVKTEKMNMLNVGTAKDKDWVLYASAADPTLMRNRLVFDTYQAMRPNDWGVHSRYVELIVDGEHKGVYVLMDKITKNDNRVKLNEDNGFIVKFDKTDCADRFGGYNNIWGDEKTFKTTYTGYDYVSTYDTHIDQRFEIEYPEKDDYTIGWSSKVKSIQAMFQAFEDALKTGDYATVQKYIDYDSWADWFIINEYTKNVDAYRASCIFVYTGEDGAKIEARPLWDQELSFNNQCPNYMSGYGSNDATGFLIQKDKVYEQTEKHIAAPFWFTGGGTDITGGLLSDPCFVQIVKEKWSKYSTGSGPLTEDVLKAKIDAYTTELGEAKNREADYWELHSRSTLSCPWDDNTTGYNNTLVTTSLSAMYTWFANRGTGLTTAINGLTGTSFSIQIVPTDQEVTPWIPAEIAISVEPEGYDYTLEYTGENKLGDIANAIIEKEDNKITYRIPRPDAWETGNAEEGTRADFVYGIKATLNVAEGNMECGSQAAPSSIASITLQDEENDECE